MRRLVAATALLLPCGPGLAQDGVAFVGDLESPSGAQAASPSLPMLSRTGAAQRADYAAPTRAEVSAAVSSHLRAREAEQAPRGLLSRGLGSMFGRDDQQAAPQPVAARPVQQAAYNQPGGGIATRQGGQPTGIFSGWFGRDREQPRPAAPQQQQAQSRGAGRNTRAAVAPRSNPVVTRMNAPQGTPRSLSREAVASSRPITQNTPMQHAGSQAGPAGASPMFVSDLGPRTPSGVAAMPRPMNGPTNGPMSAGAPAFVSDATPTPPTSKRAMRPAVDAAPQPAPGMNSAVKPAFIPAAPVSDGASPLRTQRATVAQVPQSAAPTARGPMPAPRPLATQPAPMAAEAPRSPVTNQSVVAPPVRSAQATPQQPSVRAAELLTEAQALASRAQTDEELTRVVQRCNQVLAIDQSELAQAYSRELCSWALNKRGELKADAGQPELAKIDFDDSVRMDPTRWRALHNRGVMMAQEGRFAEAFAAFNRTIELNDKFAKAYSNRAALYVQSGDLERALADYQSAIQADPDLAVAHKGRGRVCHALGRPVEAIQHFDAAAMLDPNDADAAACRADLLVDMGRYAHALAGYRAAIQLDPNLATAHRNLAWMLATCPDAAYRNGPEAVTHARKALELAGAEDDIGLDTLAAGLAAAGQFDQAVATIERAISLAPAGDRDEYTQRLALYRAGKPFQLPPVGAGVQQAAFTPAGSP